MLERKIYSELLKWKEKTEKKSLLIKGARQVGKTYIIDNFCKNNYKNYIYINFYNNEKLLNIFEGSLEIDEIIKKISIEMPNVNLEEKNTIIFLDEIQECPNAITALKFFSLDKRFDVIASGSLLGINYKEIKSYPVGYVEHLQMNSMDFEEFCWALGVKKNVFDDLKIYFKEMKTVPIAIHEKMLDLFKEYIIVGGMPSVVASFVENHNFNDVLRNQRNIIEDYKMDIGKYAKDIDKAKIRECFISIPRHLAKDYKKFRYSLVSSGGKSEKYQGALQWLLDADIINVCNNISVPELPFEGNIRDEAFKVYLKDTGLLVAMLEDGSASEIFNGNLGIYKGAIYENIIADIFNKLGKKLYYFEYNSTLEIDFLIKYEGVVTGIEVKSANNTKSKSLNSLLDNWDVSKGIKLSSRNIGISEKNKIINIPIYMAIFL